MKEEGRSQRGPAGDNVIMIRLHGGERERGDKDNSRLVSLFLSYDLQMFLWSCVYWIYFEEPRR